VIGLGVALGVGFGLTLGLVPGLHLGLLLSLLATAAWHSGLPAPAIAAFLAAAAGVGLYTKRLSLVYHPAAGADNLASLDPAMRLALSGQGRAAVLLGVWATDWACLATGVLLAVLALASLVGFPLVQGAQAVLAPLGFTMLLVWVALTWHHARNKAATAFGLLAAGLFGYLVLHHPGLRGNAHQLAPILTGFFALPAAVMLLQAAPASQPVSTQPVQVNAELVPLGLGLGALTGFLAGLGAGSLASLAQSQTEGDGDYLVLAASAEAMNDWMALLLMLWVGLGRSGEAIALGQFVQPGQTGAIVGTVAVLAASAYLARRWVLAIQDRYASFVQAVPRLVWFGLILLFSLGQLALTGQFALALALTLAGFCLAMGLRQLRVPQQVSFGTLVFPLFVHHLGLVPTLNGWMF
jgi:TctA family transporter